MSYGDVRPRGLSFSSISRNSVFGTYDLSATLHSTSSDARERPWFFIEKSGLVLSLRTRMVEDPTANLVFRQPPSIVLPIIVVC